jgi:hypothetical protein
VWFSLNPAAHILALVVKAMLSETKKPVALDFFVEYFNFFFRNDKKY